MKLRLVTAFLGVLFGCGSTANPRSCLDGLCSDPDYPFCDVDGSFGGEPKECINAACTAGEFTRCVGSDAYTCNAFGNSYETEACAHGCDDVVGGCRVCTVNSDCDEAMPICDGPMNQCRQCAMDDECESTICDRGRCIEQASIVYVAANGSGAAACTLADPCSVSAGLTKATTPTPPLVLRMLPGTYPAVLFNVATTTPLAVVASGAIIDSNDAFVLGAGANLAMRGGRIVGGDHAVTCGPTGLPAKLSLTNVVITNSGDFGTMVLASNCDLTISSSEIIASGIGQSISTLAFSTDATAMIDRLYAHGARTGTLLALGRNVHIRTTNSLFENFALVFNTSDTAGTTSSLQFEFNTIVQRNSDTAFSCQVGSAYSSMSVFSNIIVGFGQTDVLTGSDCQLGNNVLRPMNVTPMYNLNVDPLFVDAEARNYRLQASSPAVDSFSQSPVIPNDHDFDGAPRPQSGGYDIGAFER